MKMRSDREEKKSMKQEYKKFARKDLDMEERRRLFFVFVRFVFLLILSLAVIGVGAYVFVSIRNYGFKQKQRDGYYSGAAEIRHNMDTRMDELNDKFAVERLRLFFTQEEIIKNFTSMWKYELMVNDELVEKDVTALSIKEGDKIYLRESLKEHSLPADFISVGNLVRGDKNDAIKNHFILNDIAYALEEEKDGFITDYVIKSPELKPGKKFEITLSVQLEDRLSFENNVIEVTVTK